MNQRVAPPDPLAHLGARIEEQRQRLPVVVVDDGAPDLLDRAAVAGERLAAAIRTGAPAVARTAGRTGRRAVAASKVGLAGANARLDRRRCEHAARKAARQADVRVTATARAVDRRAEPRTSPRRAPAGAAWAVGGVVALGVAAALAPRGTALVVLGVATAPLLLAAIVLLAVAGVVALVAVVAAGGRHAARGASGLATRSRPTGSARPPA